MTLFSIKPKVWLVTLDTNSPPYFCLGQVGLQVGRVGYWGELAVGRIDCKLSICHHLCSSGQPQTSLTSVFVT